MCIIITAHSKESPTYVDVLRKVVVFGGMSFVKSSQKSHFFWFFR